MLDPQLYVIMYGLTGGQQDDQSVGKLPPPQINNPLECYCFYLEIT